MKLSLGVILAVALALFAVSDRAAVVQARRYRVLQRQDGDGPEDASHCIGLHQLQWALRHPSDDLHERLAECVEPLLLAGFQHVSASQATEYFTTPTCRQVLTRLQELPACTWRHIPAEDSEASMARRVVEDCAPSNPLEKL